MKKTSYILYTNNDEKNIKQRLQKAMDLIENDDDQLIIIDDLSEDETVPIIVSQVGTFFMDEEHYLFHINTKRKGKTKSVKLAKKLASNWHKEVL